MDDRAVVARQLGREPRTFRRVVVRCPWGLPAVTEQEPYGADGEPFPTTYYLTCRHLVAAVSRLEAAGGVERWSATVARDSQLRDDLVRATAEQVRIRRELAAGDDGLRRRRVARARHRRLAATRAALKCLHAHVAFALACPGYRLGEAMLAEVPERWPERCCSLV